LLKRGFKSQCERRSVEIRKGFELKPDDPLSAFALAQNMDVVVWNEQNIEGLSEADFRQLTQEDFDSWSAFTMRVEDRHLVVYNSTQSAARQNSVLMHELSHIMLGHELTSASLTEDGHFVPTTYDQDQEDEADWLAGTLLLPRPALLKIRYSQMTDQSATEYFKVSNQMLIWRFRMTGVDYQILAARNRAS
jgi:Zn-dependent peptidase ImmA (M78 family)